MGYIITATTNSYEVPFNISAGDKLNEVTLIQAKNYYNPHVPLYVTMAESMKDKMANMQIISGGIFTNTNMYGYFENMTALTVFNMDAPYLTSTYYLFHGSTGLTEINANFESATDIEYMQFNNYPHLKTVNINFNSVKSLQETFSSCPALEHIALTANATTTLYQTFQNDTSLTSVTVEGNQFTTLQGTFKNCSSLKEVNIDASNVTSIAQAFYGCESLTEIIIDCPKATNFSQTFYGCKNLKFMSGNCISLKDGYQMFANCPKLEDVRIDLRNANVYAMFSGMTNLKHLETNLKSQTNTWALFDGCTALTDLLISQLPAAALYLTASPVSYDSIVYIATNTEKVSWGQLNLSQYTMGLSATTDIHLYWNLLASKGIQINGYNADTSDLPAI